MEQNDMDRPDDSRFLNLIYLDLPLLLGLLAVSGLGLVVLYSAGQRNLDLVLGQGMRLGLGFTIMLVLAQMPVIPGSAGAIRRMAKAVEQMLKDALDAYIHRDVELAIDVRSRDQDVDQMYNALFREFLTHMMEDPRNITACMHLHFIAKNIERSGDHVTSIAEQVIYLATGEAPTDARPKTESVMRID